MGQKLSCFSKRTGDADAIPQTKTPKPLKKGKKQSAKKEAVKVDEVGVVETIAPSANHGVTEATSLSEPQRRKPKLVLLKPAPTKCKLPSPAPQQSPDKISPNLDKSTFVKPTSATTVNINNPQTVDQIAHELAHNDARPATWADLYWALIGSREFNTDEAKVKALFSWLCSIPTDRDAFVTMEELEQGVKDGVEFADEAKKLKSKTLSPDSPEVVVNEFTRGKSTYLRAFESLCRYSGIPCRMVKGLAKGVDYTVGMKLTDQKMPPEPGEQSPIHQIQHAWNAAYIDGKWALFDSMWAAERLAMSANARLSQIAKVGKMEYETDMFYFNANPSVFIYSHFPFEEEWQLLNPPMTLQQFQDGVLLKPAFFTHGLGLFSHQEGVIQVKDRLIVRLAIPPNLVNVLLFTFNLKLDGRDEMFEGVNLSRFGMHEISPRDCTVTFSFRFPKTGAYKLTMYARKVGDPLFTDICEYRVEAKGHDSAQPSEKPGSINIPPFPPTAQSHYGPTEKASDLKVKILPPDMDAIRKSTDGVFEVRFAMINPTEKLVRMTARLKSLLHETSELNGCILVRTVDACPANTLSSVKSGGSTGTVVGHPVPTCVITAFLPSAGEYALEVYGAPANADEDTSYFLVWQLLIDADCGIKLSPAVRKHLATVTLGSTDSTWSTLGLRTVSHPDPLIHVPTKGARGLTKTRSKSEVMREFVNQSEKLDREKDGPVSHDSDTSALKVPEDAAGDSGELDDETVGPRSCDLKIVLERSTRTKPYMVGHLVDINEAEEEDCTSYLLQQVEQPEDSMAQAYERITYLIRIPKADHFFKFYLYAAVVEPSQAVTLPLVYTYLLEAPQRLMSGEVPYIGVQHGAFPEKLEKIKQSTKTS